MTAEWHELSLHQLKDFRAFSFEFQRWALVASTQLNEQFGRTTLKKHSHWQRLSQVTKETQSVTAAYTSIIKTRNQNKSAGNWQSYSKGGKVTWLKSNHSGLGDHSQENRRQSVKERSYVWRIKCSATGPYYNSLRSSNMVLIIKIILG